LPCCTKIRPIMTRADSICSANKTVEKTCIFYS
jgi:hypothetical protein